MFYNVHFFIFAEGIKKKSTTIHTCMSIVTFYSIVKGHSATCWYK